MKIIKEGQLLGLQAGAKVLIVRTVTGVSVAGCEKLIAVLEAESAFKLEDVPDAMRATVEQMVLSPDSVRDSDRPQRPGNPETYWS